MPNPFLRDGADPTERIYSDALNALLTAVPPVETALPSSPPAQAPASQPKARRAASNIAPDAYRPLFEAASRKHKVPLNLLMALGAQESGFNPLAEGQPTQWGTAKGMMQYLDGTAAGLGINPFDPAQSVDAAARQFAERLAKGYSPEEAVQAHFAGDDRALWKDKTERYRQEILERAADIKRFYQQRQAVKPKPAAPAVPQPEAEADSEGLFSRLGRQAREGKARLGGAHTRFGGSVAAPQPDLGVMSGAEGMPPNSTVGSRDIKRSGAPVSDAQRLAMKMYLERATPEERRQALASQDWRGSVARQLEGERQAIAQGTPLARADGPGLELPGIPREQREAGYLKRGYAASQAADLAEHDLQGRTDAVEPSRLLEQLQAARGSVFTQMGQDVARGGQNLKGMALGLAAAGYDAMGMDGLADRALLTYVDQMERNARGNPAVVGTYRNVKNLGDAGRYAVEAVLENLPMMLPSLVSGGVGAVVARRGAETLVQSMVREGMRGGASRAAAEKAAQAAIARRITLGAGIPASASSVAMETGSIMGEVFQDTGQKGSGRALVFGLPAGLLDSIVPIVALRKMAGPLADELGGHVLKRLGAETGKQFLTEAGTEGAQTLIEKAAVMQASGRWELNRELLDELIDAALKGGIGGAALGGGSQGVQLAREQAAKPTLGKLGRAMSDALKAAEFATSPEEAARQSLNLPRVQLDAQQSMNTGTTRREIEQTQEASRREREGGAPQAPLAMRGDQDVLSGYQDRLAFAPLGSLSRALAEAAPTMAAAQRQQAELQAQTPVQSKAAPEGLVEGEAVQMATPVGPRRATVLSVEPAGMVRVRDEDGEVFAIAADKQGPFRIEKRLKPPAPAPASEPAADKAVKPAPVDAPPSKPAPAPAPDNTAPAGLSIEDTASGKGIVVKDPGQRHAERIKRIPGTRASWSKAEQGWLIAKAKEAQVREALADLLASEPSAAMPLSEAPPSLARSEKILRKAVAKLESQLDEQRRLQRESEAGNAWVYDDKIDELKRVLSLYRQRLEVALKVKDAPHAAAEEAKPAAAEAKAAAPETSEAALAQAQEAVVELDARIADAAAEVADILADVFKAKANMSGTRKASELLPAMSKLMGLLMEKGAREFAEVVKQAYQALRQAEVPAETLAQISDQRWRAAYNAISEDFDGAETEAAVHAQSAAEALGQAPKAARLDGVAKKRKRATVTDAGQSSLFQAGEPQAQGGSDGVGQKEVGGGNEGRAAEDEHGPRPLPARTGLARDDSDDVAAGQPADVGGVAGAGDQRGTGLRVPAADVGGGRSAGARGLRSGGREGGGVPGASDAGAGSGGGHGRADELAVGRTQARGDGDPGRQAGVVGGRGGVRGGRGRDAKPSALSAPAAAGFRIEDPLSVVGGGPVARFNKNREAIALYQSLKEEGRAPSREEQAVLAGFTGWGSFGQELFQGNWETPRPKEGWEARDQWLRATLGREPWQSMQRSIINAHYTDPPTVLTMWEMARRLGFAGGRVLEPSMGIGNFYGMMPADLRAASQLAGVELDEVTGSMAQLLYPEANIRVMGYEQSATPDHFYDLVIGNWPFENTVIADRRYNRLSPYLHDYFFLKAIDQVRPGGLVIGITSSGTLDKQRGAIRTELAKKAELVVAFRLPSGAFEQYAGTKVVTDIVILQKREQPLGLVASEGWIDSVEAATPSGQTLRYNEYYQRHPEHVLGTIDYGHGTTFNKPGLIVKRPQDMAAQLQRIVDLVPAGRYRPRGQAERVRYQVNHSAERVGALIQDGNGLYVSYGEYRAEADQVLSYATRSAKQTLKREAELRALIDLRQRYAALIDAQSGEAAGKAEQARDALKQAYQAFVAAHGPLTASFGLKYLKRLGDPFHPTLAALESEAEDGTVTPAAILSRNTMRGRKTISKPSVSDAFVLARNEAVAPTLARIAKLAGQPEAEVKTALVDRGAVFVDPASEEVIPSDIYLSGNVRAKLREAEAALNEGNEAMRRNVEALKAVIPADIPYYKIEAQMGATWVAPSVYADFVAHMLNLDSAQDIEVKFAHGGWRVAFPGAYNSRPEASAGFGSGAVRFSRLLEAAMSNLTLSITYHDPKKGVVKDEEKTKAANAAKAEMRQKFGEWLWSDAERRVQLERDYNEARNAYATAKFDGSFLGFEGMALSLGKGPFNLREHQVNAIWRGLVTRKSLNAHEVGTGKTFTMGGIALESRRYGIARKPLLLAHNANSASVAADIQKMYPAAKLLYLDNLSRDSLDTRMRQIANDDWDVVVMPHSLINRLGFKQETLMAMAKEEIDALESDAIDAATEDGGGRLTVGDMDALLEATEEDNGKAIKKLMGKIRSTTAKELVKKRNRVIQQIRKLAQQASKEGAIPFEELGIDMVLVDEAHEFKKPPFSTRMKMKGLQQATSDRSISLSFITRYVRAQNGGGNVHLFTGTPITNTMTEVFHQMRYIMGEEMEAEGVADWDGWFGSFAREVEDVELNAAGEYEAVTRLASFINVPELRRMLGQYMDVVFADDMPEMRPRQTTSGKTMASEHLSEAERAELLSGRTENAENRPYKKVIVDNADLTAEQMRVFQQVQGWAAGWRKLQGKARKAAMAAGAPESPIIHEGIASKASFDVRLVNSVENAGLEGTLEDDPSSKASRAIKNLIEIYHSHPLANQVVFSDLGISERVTRNEGEAGSKTRVSLPSFSTIKDMIARLVSAGIPREQIAHVTGSTSKQERDVIAGKMNSGELRIVFGSSGSLGVGVNMQRNLRAMHHLDAPWMPGDLEQRNGRGHRQGNQWNTVLEYRYITDKLDGRRWQVLAIKQRFIQSFMKAADTQRVIEGDAAADEHNDILSTFAEAAGDPRILIREKLSKKKERLLTRERMHSYAVVDARRKAKYLGEEADKIRQRLEALAKQGTLEKLGAMLERSAGSGFEAIIGGHDFANRKAANDFVKEELAGNLITLGSEPVSIGRYGGETLWADWNKFEQEPHLAVKLGGESFRSLGPSLFSLDATLRKFHDTEVGKLQGQLKDTEKSVERMRQAAAEPFHLQEELARAQQQLDELEQDIQLNPVAPPAWLRAGAPVETGVFWKGREYTVSGHRWNEDGWFVLAEDERGAVVIPYEEVKDGQGIAVYEAREFDTPTVYDPKAKEPPPVTAGDGAVRLSQSAQAVSGAGLTRAEVERRVQRIAAGYQNRPDIEVAASYEDLPGWLREEARQQGGQPGMVRGAYDARSHSLYLVAGNHATLAELETTLLHELIGHHGLNQLAAAQGKESRDYSLDLFAAVGGKPGLLKLAKGYGVDLSALDQRLAKAGHGEAARQWVLADELFALAAERYGRRWPSTLREGFKRVLGRVRAWLRRMGFAALPRLNDADLAQRVSQARQLLMNTPLNEAGRANEMSRLATKREPTLPGQVDSISEGLGAFAKLLLHPRHIAALRREFTPVYETIEARTGVRDKMVHDFYKRADPYFKLAPAARAKVDAVLELGRLSATSFQQAEVENSGHQARLSQPGEVIKLNAAEFKAYRSIRRTMDDMLEVFKQRKVYPAMEAAVLRMGRPDLVDAIYDGNAVNLLDREIAKLEHDKRTLKHEPKSAERDLEIIKLERQQQELSEMAMTLAELEQVKQTGYVPFSRHGDVVIAVKQRGADGEWETVHSEMVEVPARERRGAQLRRLLANKRTDNKASYLALTKLPSVRSRVLALEKQFAQGRAADIKLHVMDMQEKALELSDLSLSEVNNLARIAGVNAEEWERVQQQMREAIQAKGYRRHFFSSKLVPGYDPDFERSIAGYILSFAGYMARDQFAERLEKSTGSIKNGGVREYAKQYVHYVEGKGGGEEFARWRAGVFLMYIAGVPASAVANMTQPLVLTVPALGQFVGAARAMAEVATAAKDAAKMFSFKAGLDQFHPERAPTDVRAALGQAWANGAFVALATHEAQGFAYNGSKLARGAGRKANEIIARVAYLFSLAERFNRLTTFIAAHRVARKVPAGRLRRALHGNQLAQAKFASEGGMTPGVFAQFMVDDTQFRMGKINRPVAMRGVGAPLLQFKGFMMQSLEAWYRLAVHQDGAKMALVSLGIIVAMAGVWGLPFADDLRRWAENVHLLVTGERIDLQTGLRELVMQAVDETVLGEIVSGKHVGLALDAGIPAALGYDMRRLGLGNLLVGNDTYSLFGMPGDMVKRAVNFATSASQGDALGAASSIAPNFLKNPIQGASWLVNGVKTQAGREVVPARKVGIADALLKATGTNPIWISEERSRQYALRSEQGGVDAVKRRFNAELAKAIAAQVLAGRSGSEPEQAEAQRKLKQLREEIKAWNARKPAYHHYNEQKSRGAIKRLVKEELGVSEGIKLRKSYRQRGESLSEVFVTE